ncbi:MAG: toprim domain-containing protein [Succinatimonas sp.]|nr:toprim domain-containing protein [Succinatimonas sp.]
MFDNNLEQKITFLKGKLPDYLRAKGLNPASKFYCINPQDHDKLPTMSYDPNTLTVRCFNCKASYNIFDLLGFQYHLNNFKEQFIKAHELFLGPVNESLLIALNNYPQKPQFEFADDFEVKNELSFEDEADSSSPFKNPLFSKLQKHGKIPSPRDISFGNPAPEQNMVFSRDRFNSASVQRINSFNNHAGLFNSLNKDDFRPDFSEYISQCAMNSSNTDYFRQRGISDEVIKRFNLGYDEQCLVGIDKLNNKIYWKAAILPYGTKGYRIRNTDPYDKERFRAKGLCEIFNAQALEIGGKIFITEGEFDALSLESLGYRAIALGGVGNVSRLLDLIRTIKGEYIFYICLDNDKSGGEASRMLASAFYQMQIPYKEINLAFPYKDPNEALCQDPQNFEIRLNNLEQLLNLNLIEDLNPKNDALYINLPEDLLSLKLSANLYTWCGRPIALRLLLANILNKSLCSLLYLSDRWQCQNLETKYIPSQENKAHFLEISGEDILNEIKDKLNACGVKGSLPDIIIVDALTFELKETLRLARYLNMLTDSLKRPIILLGNTDVSSKVESLSLQNLEISLTAEGAFKCTTINAQGLPVSFIKKFD